MLESKHKAHVSRDARSPEGEGGGARLTHILRRAQDLPDLGNLVHASGQAEVHNTNVPQRTGAGQQDVLGLEVKD